MMAFASTAEAMRHLDARHGDCSFLCFYTLMDVHVGYTIENGKPALIVVFRARLDCMLVTHG